ncbi:GDSL-like Lipase/Acylhydrolase [Stieleria maiorica]|uniref:GDSL-like Lipase/Acylhydrolase n=1 Tax=Stieleria maiorica TaxID=2795974 RepID=A0A5B9MNB8_9BACT|nr:SGNH/GDSL hydrolase family protein [Stieleria maiorica]QEG01066.1 GDSL-like Lipase/Acylhydrolase [Stieleria maiorica]
MTGNAQPAKINRKKLWMFRLVLLTAAMVLSGLMAEAIVRIAKPGFLSFRIPQIEHRPAPGIGFEMIPDQQGYTFAEPATINSHGLRNPPIRNRDAVDLRVMCLGDSITFGVGVSDAVPYPRQLEQLLQRHHEGQSVEVINCGVQRYSTYQVIDYLREAVKKYRPDIVTLAVYYNDLDIRPEGDYSEEYENEREQVASSFRKRAPWLYLLVKQSATIELTKKAYLGWKHGDHTLRQFAEGPTEREEKRWEAMAEDLATFSAMAQEYQFRPLVVTIPGRVQVEQSFPEARFPSRVLNLCDQSDLPAVNVLPAFVDSLQRDVDPYLAWDNHMSAVGHRIVAETLDSELRGAGHP